jgi:hypothetical protein
VTDEKVKTQSQTTEVHDDTASVHDGIHSAMAFGAAPHLNGVLIGFLGFLQNSEAPDFSEPLSELFMLTLRRCALQLQGLSNSS